MRPYLSLAALLAAALAAPAQEAAPGVSVDPAKRTVTVDARVAPRKLEHLAETYPIEVVASWPHPRGKKAHETVVTFEANPSDVHKAVEGLGAKAGKPAKGEGAAADGPEVLVFVDVPAAGGGVKRLSLDKLLIDPKTKRPFPKGVKVRFTGSVLSAVSPDNPDEKKYGADLTGTLLALFPVTDETVFQTSLTMKEEKYLKLDVNRDALPPAGTPVKLVIEVPAK